ncbi:unnamed protein product [Lampetra fluviatilis]
MTPVQFLLHHLLLLHLLLHHQNHHRLVGAAAQDDSTERADVPDKSEPLRILTVSLIGQRFVRLSPP